jgi:ribonuclease Z
MSDKPFDFRLINGLQGDPAVFVLLKRMGEALLFDLGTIDNLGHRDMLRVRHVFVSHAHMDHFVGFDRLLRVNVPHRRQLSLFGPEDFIERVRCKLNSYTWNLIDPDQIRFLVHEVRGDGSVWSALLTNTDKFAALPVRTDIQQHHLVTLRDGSQVGAALLDHKGIPSVSYKLEAPAMLKVLTEKLKSLHLKAGPWLGDLQMRVRTGKAQGMIDIDGREFSIEELSAELITQQRGRSLVYLTDLSFSGRNLDALQKAFGHASDGIAESSFADEDRSRAVDKAHLTSRQSALICRSLGIQHFHIFHVSGIYGQGPQLVAEEARNFFHNLPGPGPELDREIAAELAQSGALGADLPTS